MNIAKIVFSRFSFTYQQIPKREKYLAIVSLNHITRYLALTNESDVLIFIYNCCDVHKIEIKEENIAIVIADA